MLLILQMYPSFQPQGNERAVTDHDAVSEYDQFLMVWKQTPGYQESDARSPLLYCYCSTVYYLKLI